MARHSYFDTRQLAPPPTGPLLACPVRDCSALLATAASQWGEMPYCPQHGIRLHERTRTFVYYNGSDRKSKDDAALRNIVFERAHFLGQILGNASKAESHRICHETSEDALTWNVFGRLARAGRLRNLVSSLTHLDLKTEPELYLWGLNVVLDETTPPHVFPHLHNARQRFERGISRFLTEPDIILYVPGQLLFLVEAKFTSGNTIASTSMRMDVPHEKPKSIQGIVERYAIDAMPADRLVAASTNSPFYSQLYRNLVFAFHMARELDVPWYFVNLVCETQFSQRQRDIHYQDPSCFVRCCLPDALQNHFVFYSWERLYADHVSGPDLGDLAEYMRHKSAYCAHAFALS